ncbi:hypothetical protein SAMN05421636_101546 [Pricia antarctica]|uniref:Uncharacterized protein n=1 Tax=Pricia antarctica TaxID=641691 RepID=A0A1G6X8F9_9FLAO|nr:hypothetical protein SAMN05421636_101546 [Pricia antarctica]
MLITLKKICSKGAQVRKVYTVQTNNLTAETTDTTCIIRNFPPKYIIIINDEEEKESQKP